MKTVDDLFFFKEKVRKENVENFNIPKKQLIVIPEMVVVFSSWISVANCSTAQAIPTMLTEPLVLNVTEHAQSQPIAANQIWLKRKWTKIK